MSSEHFLNALEFLQCQYLCCKPVKLIDWKDIITDITWKNQELLLDNTLYCKTTNGRDLPISYRLTFLRHIIDRLEALNTEVHDQVYERYVMLLDEKSSPPKYVYKHHKLPEHGHTVSVKESQNMISDGTTGLYSWEAACALAEWAVANSDRFGNKNIIELGSGTGLTGFVVAKCCRPKKMVLTDGNGLVLSLLRENYADNFENDDSVVVEELDWNSVEQSTILDKVRPDLIMAADLVYDNSLFVPLSQTLDYIFKRCENLCLLILTCTIRNDETFKEFMQLLDSMNFERSEELLAPPKHLYWDGSTPIKIFSITRKSIVE